MSWEEKPAQHAEVRKHSLFARVGLVAVVLVVGVGANAFLGSLKEKPKEAVRREVVLTGTAVRVAKADIRAELSGYGTARAKVRVMVSPEVGGRVVSVHPRLDAGEVIPAGEVLFALDSADYASTVETRRAEVDRLNAELARLEVESARDREELKVSQSMQALYQSDYDRVKALVDGGGAESVSRLDLSRRAVLGAEMETVRLQGEVELYDSRRRTLEAQLRAAQAAFERAERDFARTSVKLPFDARIGKKDLEVDQVLMANQVVIEAMDDSVLEVPITVDSREASAWLEVVDDPAAPHWFNVEKGTEVGVRWTEDPFGRSSTGRLVRAESYDSRNRTFVLVAEVERGTEAESPESRAPLTDGMFCEVTLPGRMLHGVVPVPRVAVDSESRVLLDIDGRLKTRPVEVVRYQGEAALVSQGLETGDVVITSRPPDVIEGAKVSVKVMDDAMAVVHD